MFEVIVRGSRIQKLRWPKVFKYTSEFKYIGRVATTIFYGRRGRMRRMIEVVTMLTRTNGIFFNYVIQNRAQRKKYWISRAHADNSSVAMSLGLPIWLWSVGFAVVYASQTGTRDAGD